MAIRSMPPQQDEFHVMVAGLPRTGKSQALNNIFDLQLDAEPGAESVTQLVNSIKVVKNGMTLTVIDTPGLKALDVDGKAVLLNMTKLGVDKDFALLLTLPVYGSTVGDDFRNVVKNLNTIFGSDIWHRCILLLTHTDTSRNMDFDSDELMPKYQNHVKSYCRVFEELLKQCKIKKRICLFSEYENLEQFKNETLDGIVAMPVAKRPDYATKRILPEQPWAHDHKWTDLLLMELSKIKYKTTSGIPQTLRKAIICFRYGLHLSEEGNKRIFKEIGGAMTGGAAGALAKLQENGPSHSTFAKLQKVPGAVAKGAEIGAFAGYGAREIGVQHISIPTLVRHFISIENAELAIKSAEDAQEGNSTQSAIENAGDVQEGNSTQ